ncbi:MAG: histidine--tRNA ligase [Bacteroidota bacterium]|nr:histidine--tRNA ligase [Bacteroidota bacterium]
MKKINPSLPKGTRDFGPEVLKKRNYVFNIFRKTFSLFGFNSIETPSLENIEILNGQYGDEGDKLIFRILNSGEFLKKVDNINDLSSSKLKNYISTKGLRYDLTVPLARFVSSNRENITLPFKRYQIQKVWRADRPQKGRFREFYQCDVDYIGSRSLVCEAEIIKLVYTIFKKLNIDSIKIKLNNRKILTALSEVFNFSEKFNQFCVLVDKIDKIGKDQFQNELKKLDISKEKNEKIVKILFFKGSNEEKVEFLKLNLSNSDIGIEGLNEIEQLLTLSDNFEFDLSLARGLSYYTSTIFEVISTKEDIGSLCGGGRYDDLTEVFGYKDISGIGISFGIERIIEVMIDRKLFPEKIISTNKVLVSYLSEKYIKKSIDIASIIRKENISVDLYSDNGKLKKQLQYANNNNISNVIIVGEDEIKSNLYTLKNMEKGTQEKLSIKEIISKLS